MTTPLAGNGLVGDDCGGDDRSCAIALPGLSEAEWVCLRSTGENRAVQNFRWGALDDVQTVGMWLEAHQRSPHTQAAYCREARRVLLWCARVRKQPLSALSCDDLLAYRTFLANPQPACDWVGRHKVSPTHPAWRPFSQALSATSVRQAMHVVAVLFTWLHRTGHLLTNPIVWMPTIVRHANRLRERPCDAGVHRTIPILAWERVMLHLVVQTPSDVVARLRWLVTLFGAGLKIGEVCAGTMGHFVRHADPVSGDVRWELAVCGPRSHWRRIPVTDECLAELVRYRTAAGLRPLPTPGEQTPLVLRIQPSKHDKPLHRAALHKIVKRLFRDSALKLRQDGWGDEAAALERASAHWIRNTTAARMVHRPGVNLTAVRDFLGHRTIDATRIVVGGSDEALREQLTQRHPIGWPAA